MENANLILSYLRDFSYPAIVLLSFFSGYIIPIPEEIVLLIIGYIASQGIISFWPAVIITAISLVLSDNVLFRLSRIDNRFINHMRDEVFALKVMKYRERMEKHIGWTIFITRFTPFLRFVGPILSGTIKTSPTKFQIYNTLAVLIYTPLLISLGYIFHSKITPLIFGLERVRHIVVVVFWVVIGIFITHYLNRKLIPKINEKLNGGSEEKKTD